jgi:hypothetical protein
MKKGELSGEFKECMVCNKKKYYKPFKIKTQKYFFCSKKCMSKLSSKITKENALRGEKHHNWSGDKVKYQGLHTWIKRYKKKVKNCEECGKKLKLEIANLSGEYKRDIKDFRWLCRGCHQRYDKTRYTTIEDGIKSIKVEDCDEIYYDIETETSNFIANGLITHNCKPNRKSISTGIYMPYMTKEKIEICLAIDLSGSIGKEEYSDFFSEIVGIARAYQERITMKFYSHDSDAYYCGEVRNGNIEELMKLDLKGGGGTDFNCVIKKIQEDNVNPKLLLWLTDGQGTELTENPFKILWLLSKKNSSDEIVKKYGEVIKL